MLTLQRRASAAGFSVIEAVITISVLALLVFAVMPDVAAFLTNLRVRSTAESFVQGLQRARNEAVRTNSAFSFWLATPNAQGTLDNSCALSSSATAWIVSVNDPSGKCGAGASATVDPMIIEHSGGELTVSSSVSVSALQSDGATAATGVTFDGFGRVSSPAAIRSICLKSSRSGNDFRPLQIELTLGGSIRLCEPRVTSSTDPRMCQVTPPASCT